MNIRSVVLYGASFLLGIEVFAVASILQPPPASVAASMIIGSLVVGVVWVESDRETRN